LKSPFSNVPHRREIKADPVHFTGGKGGESGRGFGNIIGLNETDGGVFYLLKKKFSCRQPDANNKKKKKFDP
jgi:hypothetical protein